MAEAAYVGADHTDVGSTEVSQSPGGTQYAAETARAGAAAEQAGLGRPGLFFSNTKLGAWWKAKDAGSLIYEFEGGLVSVNVGGAAEVFPWDRITEVTQVATHDHKRGTYMCTQFKYTVTRDDGVSMKLTGSYLAPEQSSLADPNATGTRFFKFGQKVNRRVSEARLPDARAALARGEVLRFSYMRISADGIVQKNDVLPWSQIRDVVIKNGNVQFYEVDRPKPRHGLPAGYFPNLPLFLTLVDELRAKAR